MRISDWSSDVCSSDLLAVALVEGSRENMKVTSQDDLRAAERWLRGAQDTVPYETRVGQGFDVHAFGPGDQVTLCGVRIAHDAGLVGHSAPAVGLQALTDAITGSHRGRNLGQTSRAACRGQVGP